MGRETTPSQLCDHYCSIKDLAGAKLSFHSLQMRKKNPKKWEMLCIFPHQRFPQGHNHLLAWLQFINPAPLQWKNKNNSIVGTIKSLFLCPSAAGAASSSSQVKIGMNSVKYTPKSFLLPVFYSPELPANMSWKFLIQGKQTLKIPNLRETNSENSQ